MRIAAGLALLVYLAGCGGAEVDDSVGDAELALPRGDAGPRLDATLMRDVGADVSVEAPSVVDASPRAVGAEASNESGSPIAPCLVGGNVFFIDGEQTHLYRGSLVVTGGTWTAIQAPDSVEISRTDGNGVFTVDAYFADPLPLAVMAYPGATRWPFATNGPGLEVDVEDEGCNTVTGSFAIYQLDVFDNVTVVTDGGRRRLLDFTASWAEWCDNDPGPLVGCVHYAVDDDAGPGSDDGDAGTDGGTK